MSDDGSGFDGEALNKINNADDSDENTSSIITINRRLKELYNEKIYIKTAPGKGSEVSLRIPIKKKN
jgi:sensor histidine kinase YesM